MKTLEITLLAAIITLVLLSACSSDNDFRVGKRQLESQGYTNITNTGYNMFCCSDGDKFSTGFKAKDKEGNAVKGCFCSSMFKGVTIRFE